jgi:CBS domain-containing protein
LEELKGRLENGEEIAPLSVREFIAWFGAQRRGAATAWGIRRVLSGASLRTVPDFEAAHLDAHVRFEIVEPAVDGAESPAIEAAQPQEVTPPPAPLIAGASADPAFRVSRLDSANRKPISVQPDCTVVEAATLMLRHDFSQLPVMTNDRDVKGMVSWESIATRMLFNGRTVTTVRECMTPHRDVPASTSLFDVISIILENNSVLVRGEDRTITGIVTTADLSLQFQQLSEPFLLLSEIENHIRQVIDGKFTSAELASVRDEADATRVIESVADLTLGEYIRLLQNPENWAKTGLRVDRKVFVAELDNVRRIRNDVMHFDPDGISEEDHKLLRNFLQFMHELSNIAQA